MLSDHPTTVLKNWSDKFQQNHPDVQVRIVTNASDQDDMLVVTLYFHVISLDHYHYRLIRFKQPIDHQSNRYGFEVFGFRDDTSFGVVSSREEFESVLETIFTNERTEQVINEIQHIAAVSGSTFQVQ